MSAARKTYHIFLITLTLLWAVPHGNAHGEAPPPDVQVTSTGDLVSLQARDADIKKILRAFSQSTGIPVAFPESMEDRISVDIVKMPPARALARVLRDINHVIVYSPGQENGAARVAKVFVYEQARGGPAAAPVRASNPVSTTHSREDRIKRQIARYEERIEAISRGLTTVDPNTIQGQRLQRQMERYQKSIERLKNILQ